MPNSARAFIHATTRLTSGLIIAAAGFTAVTAFAQKVDALDVARKNDEARRVKAIESTSTLASGGKEKSFTWWRKLQADGVHYNTLTKFSAPASIRGQGILFLDRGDAGKSDVLLYLPTFKKIRRIENQNQSGSFMGTVFSYSDISPPVYTEFDYKHLRTEACPGEEHAKVQCDVIESTPKSKAVSERTGYTKSVVWIRRDNSMETKLEAYAKDGAKPAKAIEFSKIKLVDEKNKKWMAHAVVAKDLVKGTESTLSVSAAKASDTLDDALFSEDNLSR